MDLDKKKDMMLIADALAMIGDGIREVMATKDMNEIDEEEENLHICALLAKAHAAVVKGLIVIS